MSNTASLSAGPELATINLELAKVPKSDAAVVWNATAQATIQTKATASLNAYDPPTKAEMDAGHALLGTAANLGIVLQELDQRKVAKIAQHCTTANAAENVLNINDKGVLTGITQRAKYINGQNTGHLKVTLDGVVIYDSTAMAIGSIYGPPSGLEIAISRSFNDRFDTSLRVQHWENGAGQFSLDTTVMYTIDA